MIDDFVESIFSHFRIAKKSNPESAKKFGPLPTFPIRNGPFRIVKFGRSNPRFQSIQTRFAKFWIDCHFRIDLIDGLSNQSNRLSSIANWLIQSIGIECLKPIGLSPIGLPFRLDCQSVWHSLFGSGSTYNWIDQFNWIGIQKSVVFLFRKRSLFNRLFDWKSFISCPLCNPDPKPIS